MKKIFAILTTCLLLASCAQFTELQPKGMNLLSTVDELELLLNAELEGPTSDMKRMCGDMISYANIPNELASPTPSRYTIMLTWDESKIETFNDDAENGVLADIIESLCEEDIAGVDKRGAE